MKHLLTLCLALVSAASWAQVTSLPYNSDWNNNGIIEVVDLMQLLSDYGELFSSAVVSEDEESAIVYMGQYRWSKCVYTCEQLPGIWRLPRLSDLHPVYSEVDLSSSETWIRSSNNSAVELLWFRGSNNTVETEASDAYGKRCYCASKQMPRVEYDYCAQAGGNYIEALQNLKPCIDQKLSEGWQLAGPTQNGAREDIYLQSFWRYSE